jgi:hypothetical protein
MRMSTQDRKIGIGIGGFDPFQGEWLSYCFFYFKIEIMPR